MKSYIPSAILLLALPACGGGTDNTTPGDTSDTDPYSGISEESVLRLTGTEPFWGATIEGGMMSYTTPENIEGTQFAVSRFAGRGGLSFSGEMDGSPVDVAITPGECSDGMSDRTYPFNATVQIGAQQLNGCAWREGEDELEDATAAMGNA